MFDYKLCLEAARCLKSLLEQYSHLGQIPRELDPFLDEKSFKDRKLKDFTEELVTHSKGLSEIKAEDVAAINAFIEPNTVKFIKYLKDHVRSRNDFSTLLKLIYDSSCEGD